MKKTTIKKFITLIIFMGFLLVSNENYAQCIQTTAYGAAVSDNSGLAQGITTCNYTSEYATVTGLTIGEDYVFTGQTGTTYGTGTHVYLTITDASNTVIQNGFSPQTVTTVAVSEIRIHLSDDAACATSSICHNTTVLLVTSCIVPSNLTSTNITTTAADISWDAPVNVPSGGYDYYYATMNTAPDAATTPSANITAGTTANLTALTPATTYYFWLRSNCGAETSSWSNSGTFTTACVALSVPSLEPFATFLPPCWEKATGGALNSGPDTPNSGAWYADGFANIGTTGAVKYNFYTASTNAWLMSPSYIIPAVGYELKFDAAATQFGSNAVPTTPWELDDFVEVLISDGTTGWTVLYTYNSNNSPLNTGSVNIIDLSAYSGQTVRFAYRMVEGVDNGGADIEFFVDNFQIRLTPSCVEPISLMVDNITTNSAELSWTETGTATLWNVEYGPTGFIQGAGTTMLGVTNSYVLSGLTSNTVYDYYVQADCSAATSYWSGPVTFVTNCLPFGSFSENFDTTTSGTITNCWNGLVSSTNTYAVVNVQPYTYFSTPSSVQLYNSGDAEALLFLVTPNLTDLPLGTHRLKFRVRGGTGFTIEVGTITNPSDPNTFTSVEPFQTQAAFIEYIVDFSSVVTTDNYIAIKHGLGGTYRTIYIDDVVWEPVPAAAPACASNVIAVPDAACGNFANTITWDATTGADGYYLSIGSAPGGTDMLNASNLGNILSYSFSGDFNTTYYYTVTPFNAIGSATGCVEENFTTFATGCYCVSLPTSNDNLGITNVQLAATDFPTGDVMYFDHTATTVTLNQAINTNVQIAFATGYTYDTNIWIDLNDNLTFESSEILYSGVSAATNPTILDASFIMPATAALGIHRMRIGSADTGQATPDPCYSGYYGVTLDFSVDIIAAPSCIPPTVLSATSITNASADLAWTESGTATAWDVEWGTNGFVPTGTPTIASSTNPYSLLGLAANTAYSFYVRANCGTGESSWSGPFNFTTLCDAINAFPFVETFEDTSSSRACWSNSYVAGTANWTYVTGAVGGTITTAFAGTKNARFVSAYGAATPATKLVSPVLDLTSLTTPRLVFQYAQGTWGGDQNELKVYYRVSSTDSWVEIGYYTSSITVWTEVVLQLPAPSGTYQLAFEGINNYGYANVLDNITVEESPSCTAPTSLNVSNVTNASADLGWTENGTATAWDIEWGTNGFVPTATPTIASSTNPYSLSALAANTAYSFYVRANCGDGESLWVGPFNFMTACDATNVPYTMDFDSAITPALPNCTSQQNIGAGNLWTVASAPGYGFTTNALEYSYNSTSAANVWFYTQGLSLVAGTTYSLTFDYNAASTSYPESLKVAYGTSADASSMTNVLVDLASISNNATALESITEFSPTATGVYYFGFNAYSAADQFNLYVDNINVTEALNANTFDNASFVTYPNPVNEMLNISYSSEISYINVINLLGQVVAFKNVGTNSTQIDMTDLSAGAYIVQVTVNDIVKSIKVLKN